MTTRWFRIAALAALLGIAEAAEACIGADRGTDVGAQPSAAAGARAGAQASSKTPGQTGGEGAASSAPGQAKPDQAKANQAKPDQAKLIEARRLIDRGHPQEALEQLGAAVEDNSSEADVVRGDALYALNRFSEADAAYGEALGQDPKNLEAMQMRGLTLFRLGRPADAVPLLESAHEWSSQTRADPSYVLGLCYLDTRQYDKARGAFAQQYGFPADSAQAYLLAARLLFRREYVPVAEEYARKALALDPQLPLAHGLLGEIALSQQHLEEATKELEAEKSRNPLDGSVYEQLGDVYSRKGENVQAQQALQRALLLEPYATGPYILLGKVLLRQGDAVGAANYLERAQRMDPGNFRTHSLLGQAYRALGRQEDAAREVSTAEKIQAASEPKLGTVH